MNGHDVVIDNPYDALCISRQFINQWYQLPSRRLRIRSRYENTDPTEIVAKFNVLVEELGRGDDDEEVDVQPLLFRLAEIHVELSAYRNQKAPGDPVLYRGLKMLHLTSQMVRHLAAGTEMPASGGI